MEARINLHAIASAAVSAVNPMQTVQIYLSTGYTTANDGDRVPAYADPISVPAQIQSLSFGDIQHVDNLNIQGVTQAVYVNGNVDGLVREKNKGGDLIVFPDGSVWLVRAVLEHWGTWTKVAAVLQTDSVGPPISGQPFVPMAARP